MTLRLGFLLCAALGCGDDSDMREWKCTEGVACIDGPATAPVPTDQDWHTGQCGGVATELAEFQCKTCVVTPWPHCVNRAISERFESPEVLEARDQITCGNPDCPLEDVERNNFSGFPGYPSEEPPFELQGRCADGKTFAAQVGLFSGTVMYYRDGGAVGSVLYTSVILKCECGGGGHSGDVACADPVLEAGAMGGQTLILPSAPNAIALPFADGKRASPCLCAD